MTAAKATATKTVAHHAPKEPETRYATMPWSADVAAAAGLRNGMTPAEVHAAIEKVVGPNH